MRIFFLGELSCQLDSQGWNALMNAPDVLIMGWRQAYIMQKTTTAQTTWFSQTNTKTTHIHNQPKNAHKHRG